MNNEIRLYCKSKLSEGGIADDMHNSRPADNLGVEFESIFLKNNRIQSCPLSVMIEA